MTKEELLEELIAEETDRSATAATREASEDAERWIAIYKQRLDALSRERSTGTEDGS